MAFHVFVEGATDDTPAGVARLANAIAKHYGLPGADLLVRLQRGRFRVKGNIERTLAEQYRRDLERLGARCTIEEATAENSQRATPLPFPAVRPATPPVGVAVAPSRPSTPPSGLAAAAPSRPSAPPSGLAAAAAAPSRPSTPPSGLAAAATTPASAASQFQSGLAAAFSGELPAANLGALEKDDLPLSLASVDGADEQAPPSAASFEPSGGGLSASIGPLPEKAKPAAKPERPKDVPLDLFAPPEAQGDELAVDIAADELDITAKKRPNTPPPVADDAAHAPLQRAQAEPAARRSQPSMQAPEAVPGAAASVASVPSVSSKRGLLGSARVRFAAGVLLAILIGFVPAHLVASMREGSAYKAIDNTVIAAQHLADTPEMYAMLDKMRADQLDKKRGEQRNAAIIALAIWALVGGGVAFAWFKKVPWDRFE